MNEENQELVKGIADAISARDIGMLDYYVRQAATYCFKESQLDQGAFSRDIFSLIISLMDDPKFLEMEGSHHLLIIFEYDWGILLEEQKMELLQAIRRSYEKYRETMSYFVISELLGEYYCNEASYQVLCELQSTANEAARYFIQHGFEHIAKDANNPHLRKRALSSLSAMKNDKSSKVRNEVDESLSNLRIRGIDTNLSR